jgi:PAS domain S-box-containing protein
LDEETYKSIFKSSPTPTLYVVSGTVELANPAAAKMLKRLGINVTENAVFGKLWPKGTYVAGKAGLKALRTVKNGEYNVTLPERVILTVNVKRLRGKRPVTAVVTLEDVTENEDREKALRENEEKLRAQYKSIPIPTYTWQRVGEDFILISYNDAAKAITDGNVADFVGMTAVEMFRDRPDIIEEVSRCFAGKTHIEREMVYTFKVTGESKHLAVKYAFVPPDLVLVHTEDITDRKRYEEALGEKRNELKMVFETTPDLLILMDGDFKYQAVNPAFCRFVGKLEEELVGKTDFEVFPSDQAGVYRQSDIDVMTSGKPKVLERRVKDVDGVERSLQVVKTPILNTACKPMGMLVSVRDITGLRLAENALKDSEAQYRSTIDSMHDAVHVIDREMRFVLFNSAFKEWNESLGLDTDVVGKNLFDVFAFLSDKVRDEYQRVFNTGEPLVTEEETRVGEAVFNTETRKIPIFEHGNVVRIVTVVRDITNRKRAEEELRASEEKYRTLIENAGAPVTYLNLDGTILLVNTVGAANLGGAPDDYVGKSIYKLIPGMAGKIEERIRQVVESEVGYDFEDSVELPSGRRWFYSNHQPVKDASGKVFAVQIVSQEITERKRSEEALRESEEKYRNLIERSNDAVAIIQNGVIKFANERVTEVFGYPVEELIGKNFVDYIHPGEELKLADFYERRMSGKSVPPMYETVIQNREGKPVYVEINAGVIQYEGGPADFAFVRDITERKAIEEALRESEEVFRVTFENAKDAILWAEPETGLIVNCNKAAEVLLETGKNEIIGLHQTELHPLEKSEYYAELFNRHIEGAGAVDEEAEIVTRSGRIKTVHISASLMNVAGRRILQGSFRDITQLKKVQSEREIVADVNQILAASLDPAATLSGIFNALNRLFDFDRMSIAILSEDGETFRVFEAVEKGKTRPGIYEAGTILRAAGTALNECVSVRDILTVDDLKNSKFSETKELYKTGLRTVVLLPLVIGEKAFGTWNIGSRKKGAFTVIPSTILEELSSYLALWLEARLVYEKVASSEEQYRTLQSNVPVGVFRTTAEPGGRLISTNPALAKMFGYETREDMYDVRVSDLYQNPKDREKFVETISSAGAITDYEVEFKRTDGSSFWGSLSARAVKASDGSVAYLDGILEDVTERKEAESALIDSERKYKALYETTRALSVYAGENEVLKSIGEQASILFDAYDCTIYTINRDEGFLEPRYSDSKDFRDEVMSFTVPVGLGVVGHVAETGEGLIVNYDDKGIDLTIPGLVNNREDSESVIAVPLKTKDRVTGVIILSRMGEKFYRGDLDALYAFSAQAAIAAERAELLKEVRTSEEKYRTTFESAGAAIALLEENTVISFANRGFEILAGCPREDIEGKKSWTEFAAPYELERLKRYHEERRRPGGEAPDEYEFDFLRPDDSIRRVFLSIAMVPGTKQSVASLIDITELRRAEERYRTTVESTGTAMALVDGNGFITFVNKEMEKLGGVPREDIENRAYWSDLVAREDQAGLKRYEAELREGKDVPSQVEFRFVRPHGGVKYCFLNAALLPGTDTIVVSVLDITDRKLAEEAVERERRAFAIVAEAAAQGEDIADMCERVLTGLVDTLGFDFGSLRLYDEGTQLLNLVAVVRAEGDKDELIQPQGMDDTRYFGSLIARTRKELFAPDISVHETSITHKARIEELDIKGIVGYPLIGSGDRLIGTMQLVAHNVMDLSEAENAMVRTVVEMLTVAIERRLAELAVAESEEKYRALFEQAGDAVYLETLDGSILEVNQRACDMLGYKKEELTKMNAADITPSEMSGLLPEITAELSEKGFVQMEAMNVRKDGKNIPVELNARVIDVGGRKLVFAIVRDISVHMNLVQGLKTQANELMELKRAKDTLTDLVVHDIKNISSSMLVWLELLQDGVFGQMSNEQKETVGRVIDNNIQLFDLSQELLDVARSEEGEIKLRKQPFLLDKSVTEVTEYYKPTAEKQSKILELEVKDEAVLVFADEERIRRVVSNLITNALKFVEPNEGEVKVVVEKDSEGKKAVIRVSDNGRGIPEKYQEMIFEKFMQVELRDAGFKRGAGLGLTFCKMVVARHDGDMWVESDGEHGSTFICSLPLYQ